MTYTLHGRMHGYLCHDCDEPLEGVVIRIYASVTSGPDPILPFVTAADAAARADRLLAQATIGADGSYAADLPADRYDGGPLEIDLHCAGVPRLRARPRPPAPVQLHVAIMQPRWRRTELGEMAPFEHFVAARLWHEVRSRLGGWTVCGTVTAASTRQPMAGVTVQAFDADWLADGAIGCGTTDASGHYRIDYGSRDLMLTPYSAVDEAGLLGGPHLYFRVDDAAGTPLLREPRRTARAAERRHVRPCASIDLCVADATADAGGGGRRDLALLH